MFEISEEMNWKIREKRAKERLTMAFASTQIGISRVTLGQIESGQKTQVKRTVYEKLVNWLFSPDEMGG